MSEPCGNRCRNHKSHSRSPGLFQTLKAALSYHPQSDAWWAFPYIYFYLLICCLVVSWAERKIKQLKDINRCHKKSFSLTLEEDLDLCQKKLIIQLAIYLSLLSSIPTLQAIFNPVVKLKYCLRPAYISQFEVFNVFSKKKKHTVFTAVIYNASMFLHYFQYISKWKYGVFMTFFQFITPAVCYQNLNVGLWVQHKLIKGLLQSSYPTKAKYLFLADLSALMLLSWILIQNSIAIRVNYHLTDASQVISDTLALALQLHIDFYWIYPSTKSILLKLAF